MSSSPLKDEAEIIFPILSICCDLYENNLMNSYDLVGIFILLYLNLRRSNNWSNGQLKHHITTDTKTLQSQSTKLTLYPFLRDIINIEYICKKLSIIHNSDACNNLTIACIFNQLQFSGIKKNKDNYINHSIVNWVLSQRPFHLMFTIPSPMQVLRQQMNGQRVVTLFRELG